MRCLTWEKQRFQYQVRPGSSHLDSTAADTGHPDCNRAIGQAPCYGQGDKVLLTLILSRLDNSIQRMFINGLNHVLERKKELLTCLSLLDLISYSDSNHLGVIIENMLKNLHLYKYNTK